MSSSNFELYRDDENNIMGIRITVIDDSGERTVKIGADEDGNLQLAGLGPNGQKRGKADPTGGGNNPLGK